ncbi:MAG: lipase family alpha/beta hydrolase [Ectobacillus sp.]
MKKWITTATAASLLGLAIPAPLQPAAEAAKKSQTQAQLGSDIVLIPGISGSELTLNGQTIWPPNTQDPATLKTQLGLVDVTAEGAGLPGIVPSNVTESYKLLAQTLSSGGYKVHVFPYDWRLDNAESAKQLEAFIAAKGLKKFSVIAHSMGGLVAANYMAKAENRDKVNTFIALGTPFFGTAKTLWVMETGQFFNGGAQSFEMNQYLANLSRKMTSSYELLPTRNYFTAVNNSYIETYTSADSAVRDIKGYIETQAFLRQQQWPILTKDGPSLAKTGFHLDKTAAFEKSTNVAATLNAIKDKTYFIVGDKQETIGKIRKSYIQAPNQSTVQAASVVKRISGDGTVPVQSAAVNKNKTYYTDAGHSGMVTDVNVAKQIVHILLNSKKDILRKQPVQEQGELKLTVSRSAEVHAFDAQSNHTGKLPAAGYYEEKIPNSMYYDNGIENTIFLADGSYKAVLKQTGNEPLRFTIEKYNAQNEIVQTIRFENVTVPTGGTAALQVGADAAPVLAVDENNDNIPDRIVQPANK